MPLKKKILFTLAIVINILFAIIALIGICIFYLGLTIDDFPHAVYSFSSTVLFFKYIYANIIIFSILCIIVNIFLYRNYKK